MATGSKEEQLQEALLGWVLGGGTLAGLVAQVDMFVEGLAECDRFEDGGGRQVALQRVRESLDQVSWLAGKADRAGLPSLPPAEPKPAASRCAGFCDLPLGHPGEHRAQGLPASKVVNGLELFLTFDRQGRPIYCSVPGREV